ncbi:TPA: hypothetical protein DCQ44_00585 [Candidatus Taylorbacteria bacterium]|nr:hypothetical protein [Candidatus Taylorbacteria bacterium]
MKMKRNLVGIVAVLVLLLVAPAFAGYSNSISLPDLYFSADSFTDNTVGKTTFSMSLSTASQIDGFYTMISKDASNLGHGYISVNAYGTVGNPVLQKDWQNNRMDVNYRGLSASLNTNLGAFQTISGWTFDPTTGEQIPVYGDWLSTGSGNVTLNGVTLISSTSGYNEYTYDPNGGGKGLAFPEYGTLVTEFSAYAQFYVSFDGLGASVFPGMGTSTLASSVPEPASLCLLGVGVVAMLASRRRR